LLKLNYSLKDYKKLKRRSYSLNFVFFFINLNDKKNKDITLDINTNKFDNFNIFITTNAYYIEEFYNIIDTYYNNIKEEKELDTLLDSLSYIFS
jgi:hypothetical protein